MIRTFEEYNEILKKFHAASAELAAQPNNEDLVIYVHTLESELKGFCAGGWRRANQPGTDTSS